MHTHTLPLTSLQTKDLRVKRTHKLLLDALYVLLQQKSFEDISVIDICEAAMVHRTTFYRHFEDKYHLLNFAFTQLFEQFQNRIETEHAFSTIKEYYLYILDFLLTFLTRTPSIVHLLKATDQNISLLHSFQQFLVSHASRSAEIYLGKEKLSPLELTVAIEYHIGGIINLGKWWLFNDMPISKEAFIHYVDCLIATEPPTIKKE
jgi:AcrR family transcriptional regulator